MTNRKSVLNIAIAAALACGLSTGVALADNSAAHKDPVKDAWLDGKLETVYLLNRHLNNFTIDTDVRDGTAYLAGTVTSDIDRDLAVALAKGIDGISDVKSDLKVVSGYTRDNASERALRDFTQFVDDATTTASIKSSLLLNGNTKGLKIDVDTKNDVVTLSGAVGSAKEKALAEELARNTNGVDRVDNNLLVTAR